MHYGIGPEVYADYRRNELFKAAPTGRRFEDETGDDETVATVRPVGGLRAWIGELLIAAGARLAGDLSGAGRDTRQTA